MWKTLNLCHSKHYIKTMGQSIKSMLIYEKHLSKVPTPFVFRSHWNAYRRQNTGTWNMSGMPSLSLSNTNSICPHHLSTRVLIGWSVLKTQWTPKIDFERPSVFTEGLVLYKGLEPQTDIFVHEIIFNMIPI